MPPLGAEAGSDAAGAAAALSAAAPPPPPASASVVPSSDPRGDARALAELFPSRYSLADEGTNGGEGNGDSDASAAVSVAALVGRSVPADGEGVKSSSMSSEVILLVRSASPPPLAAFPSAAIVVDAESVASAAARLERAAAAAADDGGAPATVRGGGGGAFAGASLLSRSPPSSLESRSWCVIRLPGGAAVTVSSPETLLSAWGRGELASAALAAAEGSIRGAAAIDNEAASCMEMEPTAGTPSLMDDVGLDLDVEDAANGGAAAVPPPPPSYDFPSLSMKIKSDGNVIPGFRINSRVGIPVNTDLFEGKILLIMRPPDSATDDPYWHEKVFSKKKRRFEVQIQGKFKYTPKGTVYCGAEISEQMKLGLVSKGLCNVLLKTLTRMIPADMHYAFGDDDMKEVPHIVFTAWSFFDRVVVTEEGGVPPPMGEPFPEADKAASKRKSSSGPGEWRSGVTFSMSFNSMYLDLPTWHLRSLPMMKDISLRTFWGDSLLRIVIYEKVGNPSDSRHLTKDNTYFFSIDTEFLGMPDKGGRTVKVDDQDTLPWGKAKPSISRVDSTFFVPNAANDGVDADSANLSERPISESTEDEDESDSDETAFFDAEESQTALLEDVGLDVDGKDVPPTPERSARKEPPNAAPAAAVKPLSPADRFCPGWVEMCAERGKYRKMYAFVVGGGSRIIFRSSSDFTGSFSIEEAKKAVESTCSPRLSSSEKLRRIMGLTVAKARESSSKQHGRYRTFSQKQSPLDARFLRRVAPSQLNVKVKGETIISGFVARALSEHHWKEEWVVLSDQYVSFFHPANKRPSFRVSLGGIVGVSKLPSAECPNFPGCHVLSIETTGRRIYLMFFSEKESDSWLGRLPQHVTEDSQSEPKETNILLDPLASSFMSLTGSSLHDEFLALNNDPTEEFLHKTSMFSCKERRVLNCRKFSFTGIDDTQGVHPCDVVGRALREALEPAEDSEVSNLRRFLDTAADLKTFNISELPAVERMAFFLNLYHIMATHAYLVLGVPDSSFKWVSYFNMISYQCSDEIFSLTELEHCIIREQTSSPSQFVAKFVLPKSRYSFALHSLVDWRVNFCLNCGSLSNPRSIPIFRADSLLSQINESTRLFLMETVKVSVDSRKGIVSVTLPRICQWYATDFGRGRSTDVVQQIMKYLGQREQDILSRALASDGRHFKAGALNVTFLSFDYTCRLLTLRKDNVLLM